MNKKQTIVLWCAVILIVASWTWFVINYQLYFAPTEHFLKVIGLILSNTVWLIIPVLIIGGLLIYTFRDKK